MQLVSKASFSLCPLVTQITNLHSLSWIFQENEFKRLVNMNEILCDSCRVPTLPFSDIHSLMLTQIPFISLPTQQTLSPLSQIIRPFLS